MSSKRGDWDKNDLTKELLSGFHPAGGEFFGKVILLTALTGLG